MEEVKINDIIEYKTMFSSKKNYIKVLEEDLKDLQELKDICKYTKVWKPKYKELCIFYNDNSKSLRVALFKQISSGKGKEELYKDMQGNYFEHCEPYSGTLPDIVKNNLEGKQ